MEYTNYNYTGAGELGEFLVLWGIIILVIMLVALIFGIIELWIIYKMQEKRLGINYSILWLLGIS